MTHRKKRRAGEVCPKSASKCLPDGQAVQKVNRLLNKDRRQSTYPVVAPDFSMEISLDLRKLRSYTPNRQKQCLINQSMSYQFNQFNSIAGRNPKTGINVDVKPKRLPYFKVGKELKKMVF